MSGPPAEWDRVFVRGGGHPGGSASTLRILRMFRAELRPTDILMSSKGHDAAAFLLDGVERGILAPWTLDTYRAVNGYPGHPERGVTPGAVVSTGSLGMGLSKAVGLAYAHRHRRVLCVVGDGETQEGQVWEALQHAARLALDNLVVFLDHNGAQSDNRPLPRPNILHPEGIFKAAGWPVLIADPAHPSIVSVPKLPLCVLVHGEKVLPHALSQRSPLVEAYRDAIIMAVQADPALVLLEADLAFDHGLDGLQELFPSRHILNCGICEQHMVSCAVGLAAAGLQPVCHTFERFFYRAAEQVLDALQEPGLVIRFVGGLAGWLPQGPGRSHELHPDVVRTLFPIQTYTPRTPEEVTASVVSMLRQPRSTYLRLPAQPELA